MTARELVRNLAQLTGLWALAVAQPLFDVIESGEIFVNLGWRGGDVVLFTLGVSFGPPVLLTAVEAIGGRVRAAAGRVLHLVFAGAIVAVLSLYVIRQSTEFRSLAALVLGVAAGVAGAYLLHRFEPVRSFATVTVAASFLFVGLFLLGSPVRNLVLPAGGSDLSGPAPSAPVVMIVFDEFPTLSLLDRNAELDGRSYPAFASLARDGTWYRNATTVADNTAPATSAILTGRHQDGGRPASASAHPDNLLALLSARGEVHVQESPHTRLCPRTSCAHNRLRGLPGRITGALPGLARLSLATFLPDALYEHVQADPKAPDVPAEERFRHLERSLETPGVLHYAHPFLPHGQWYRTPSGKHYDLSASRPRDFTPDVPALPRTALPPLRWTEDASRVTHLRQRHLAQVRATDRLLGRTLELLRERGLYDRALIVVTADHGIAFEPGRDARHLTEANAVGNEFVPLFVKAPGQRRGGTSGRFVQSVDIAPLVADALGIELPWRAAGRSPLDPSSPDRKVLVAHAFESGERFEFDAVELRDRLETAAAAQAALFAGDGPDRIYRPGPFGGLVGRRVNDLPAAPRSGLRHELSKGPRIEVAARSSDVPALVTGRLHGPRAHGRQLVLAVNGTIAAATVSHLSGRQARFEALADERFFKQGPNELSVYEATIAHGKQRLSRIPR